MDLRLKNRRMCLWLSVVLYTFSLQYAFIVYEAIILRWSSEFAGIIPRFILGTAGVAAVYYGIKLKAPVERLILLLPCGIVASLIVSLVDNPNKHIHIPEYILMTWLFFEAIRIDYNGRGIFLLIFLCSSCLGVVDEVLQGIHPSRSCGWRDMLINTSSSLIGVLAIMGLTEHRWEGMAWAHRVIGMRGPLFVGLVGTVGTIMSCRMLFEVKLHDGSWELYPLWLLIWNALFVLLAVVSIAVLFRRMVTVDTTEVQSDARLQGTTAALWVLLPLAIMSIINVLVVLCRAGGVQFI
jgi:hypothetical protein